MLSPHSFATVGALYVNKLLGKHIPLLEKEGWIARSRKYCEATYSAQTGAKRERDSAKP